jgi:Ohr subfamily peroxiredoxin
VKPLYTAIATAEGGRTGHVRSSDGILALSLRMPKELGGPGGEGTNPEQLFAAGYAACFESALRLVARQKKHAIDKASITAHVTIGQTDGGGFGLAVTLHASLPGMAKEQAQALLEAAHQVCPYSIATRGNIEVQLVVD